jgi:hypothetical protein
MEEADPEWPEWEAEAAEPDERGFGEPDPK